MLPPLGSDGDPDQLPWPAARRQADDGVSATTDGTLDGGGADARSRPSSSHKHMLSLWQLITLSMSMGGAQIAWTVELGYGTPFLLSLGLSEHITSLVWLAGPISGLIAQPLIGAVSDSSTSRYRRRFWIVASTIALVVSTLALAYCRELAALLVDLAGVGVGDWSEKRNKSVNSLSVGLAVMSFYVLDFALNGLQASLRNLLLDVTPPEQLSSANAWHGRMTHAGNIVGFGFGFLPLAKLPIIRLLGGGQFRKFCVVCIIILVITVWMTCFFHEEQMREPVRKRGGGKLRDVLMNIYQATVNLPKPIRRVCCVQLLAFMGWFPFLFYSTTYMGQVMASEHQEEPDPDLATRTGAFAMLLYSVVAVIAGIVLPHLASRDRRLMAHTGDEDEDAELTRIRNTVRQWRVEAASQGQPLKLPVMPFLLRNIWTNALVFFSLLTFSTFFITTVTQVTIFISLVGICWAVAIWVPFAIIMEFLKSSANPQPDISRNIVTIRRPVHSRNMSSLGIPSRENGTGQRQPLLRRRSFDETTIIVDQGTPAAPLAGGTILGIHNLAIVVPQLIVALVTSTIFRIVDGDESPLVRDVPGNTYLGKTGVAWVLRFGGMCTLIGALIARRVPPTPTEKAMRRRLGEMKLLGEENTV